MQGGGADKELLFASASSARSNTNLYTLRILCVISTSHAAELVKSGPKVCCCCRARIINLNRKALARARQLSAAEAFSFVHSFSSSRLCFSPAAQISLSKHAQKVKLALQKKFDALLQTINVKWQQKRPAPPQHLFMPPRENASSPTHNFSVCG